MERLKHYIDRLEKYIDTLEEYAGGQHTNHSRPIEAERKELVKAGLLDKK